MDKFALNGETSETLISGNKERKKKSYILWKTQNKCFIFNIKHSLICPPSDSTDQTRVLGQDPLTCVELHEGFHRL